MSQATKQEAIRDALEEIKNLQHYIKVLNELPDLPSSATTFISHYGRVYINIPYDLDTYRPLPQQLADANWRAYSIINVDNGALDDIQSRFLSYHLSAISSRPRKCRSMSQIAMFTN